MKDEIAMLTENIAAALDRLTSCINAYEAFLVRMTPFRDAAYAYSVRNDHNPESHEMDVRPRRLAIMKFNGAWRLCHNGYTKDEEDWRPLVDCSIDDRMVACSYLGTFREEIVKEKKKLLEKIEAVVNNLSALSEG